LGGAAGAWRQIELGFHGGSPDNRAMHRFATRQRQMICLVLAAACGPGLSAAEYPPAKRGPQFDDYFGQKILDPYRWLEEFDSPRSARWIAAQRAYAADAFAAMPERDAIRSRLPEQSRGPVDPDLFETSKVFCTSRDGTRVPLVITARKGLKLDGSSPAWLHANGGGDAWAKPGFATPIAAWLGMGGIYAQADIRGAGEFGQEWRDSGIRERKPNAFDDFIAAASFLGSKGYTRPDRLVLEGSGDGALVIAAVINEHPDICAVALPDRGVMDMLRYHLFKGGAQWEAEYGTSADPAMFKVLLAYSPVHNCAYGVHDPAILITTGDNDEIVSPANSYKYAAAIQAAIRTTPYYGPIVIRIGATPGPGGAPADPKMIDEWADRIGFAAHYMPAGSLTLPKGP
jgi:prolyl oligopeptidase